jgi:GntR family transcriptional regulator
MRASKETIQTTAASLHARIREALRERILEGTYPILTRLPSESELGVMFGASRITVRQALANLQRDGLIFTLQGKGSFVSRPKAYQNVSSLAGFAESMAALGHEVLNQLLDLKFVPADPQVMERLQLPDNVTVTEIRRVRLLNREPVSVELTYVDEPLGRILAQSDLISRDIFAIIENDCATPLGHADLKIDATVADDELSRALRIDIGAPVMHIERLTHDLSGRPIDFEHLYFRSDNFQYHLRIDRKRTARKR